MRRKLKNTKAFMYSPSFFFGLALLIVSGSAIQCNSELPKEPEAPVYLNHNDTVKYVGMQTCRSCHASIYESFIKTGMGSSFDVASRKKSAAEFTGHKPVYDKFKDLYYFPFLKMDSLYLLEFRLEGKDTIHKRLEKVDYIVGSGQHTNSHMMNVNGYFYQLPITWYAQKRKWDLPPGFENGRNVRFNREIGFECMSCHNALPDYVPNSGNKFTSVPLGIDCERCHGPGAVHVKEKLAGVRVDTSTQIDYTIVNPKKLPWKLQIDVCQRCHLQGNAVLKNGKSFADFRPGKNLADFIDIYMPKYKGHEDEFIMASHAQRLQMSRCFLKSNANNSSSLTCITCHNPHVSVKVTGKQVFNTACMKCHESKAGCTEKPEIRKLNQDNCWGCHMPKSGTIDIPHVTVTDHFIRVPAKKKQQQDLKLFAGIYCINNPQSDEQTRMNAYLSYYEKFEGEVSSLDTVKGYLDKNTKPTDYKTDLTIHFLYLKQDYISIIKAAKLLQPSTCADPWLCYRIGQAYQNLQQSLEAIAWYERAKTLAPDNLDFANKLGAVWIETGKTKEGMKLLMDLLSKNPKQPETLTNLGFAYVTTQEYLKAMECYNQSLALDPDMKQTLYNKAALCNLQGNKSEAKKLLNRMLKNEPDNKYILDLIHSL